MKTDNDPKNDELTPFECLIEIIKGKFTKKSKDDKPDSHIVSQTEIIDTEAKAEDAREEDSAVTPQVEPKGNESDIISFSRWITQPFTALLLFISAMELLCIIALSVSNSAGGSAPRTQRNRVNSAVSSESVHYEIVTVSESDITEVDYKYLLSHQDQFVQTKKHYRVAGPIDGIYPNNRMIVLKDSENNELRIKLQQGCNLSNLRGHEIVTLVGLLGNSSQDSEWVVFYDSYIEEYGEAAKKTYERLNAEGDKLRAEEAKIREKEEKKKAEKARKDYIASCKTYKYRDISRNPNDYYGKHAKFKGKVVQVMEGYYDTTLRVNVTKDKYGYYSDTIYVVYTPKSTTESRILEDDIITIYGELSGIETYETIVGTSVSIPRINAEYITINSK